MPATPGTDPVTSGTGRLTVLHGSAEPLPVPTVLRAGHVTAALDGVDLRYLRVGKVELVRRIYVAVRDRNWNTIPAVPSTVEVSQEADSFEVRYSVRHRSHDTDFGWDGSITGAADGTIAFRMDGRAARTMLYNRIGFCVLHPWRESAGRPYTGETPSGQVRGELPVLVAPQRFENGAYVPLFPSIRRLEVELETGGNLVLEFDGDLFETEDQRNWTDASLKTYCTPLSLGFPHELATGEALSQAITVHPPAPPADTPEAPAPAVAVSGPSGCRLPPLGVSLSAGAPPTPNELELLQLLGAAHFRHELHLDSEGWRADLGAALQTATDLAAKLELALFLPAEATGNELADARAALAGADLARVLVAVEGAETVTPLETTPGALVAAARDGLSLGPGIPIAGGTDMYFCELNRTRPEVEPMDGVFWSMNPQVHAFDDISLIETTEAQAEQVRTAGAFAAGRELFVGPITLRRRYNVNATTAEPEAEGADELPDSVDPRQASLLGAAWTLASLKHIIERGASAATYFETVGWRGVIQGDADPPLPDLFPGRGGAVFPLFHVLADATELHGAEVLRCEGGSPLEIAVLAARRDDGTMTLLVANLTPHTLAATLEGAGSEGTVRRLNEQTVALAAREPAAFRARGRPESLAELELAPYETLRIDTEP